MKRIQLGNLKVVRALDAREAGAVCGGASLSGHLTVAQRLLLWPFSRDLSARIRTIRGRFDSVLSRLRQGGRTGSSKNSRPCKLRFPEWNRVNFCE